MNELVGWLGRFPLVAILRGVRPAEVEEIGVLARRFGGEFLVGAGTVMTGEDVRRVGERAGVAAVRGGGGTGRGGGGGGCRGGVRDPVMDYPGLTDEWHCPCGVIACDADWVGRRLRPEMVRVLGEVWDVSRGERKI